LPDSDFFAQSGDGLRRSGETIAALSERPEGAFEMAQFFGILGDIP